MTLEERVQVLERRHGELLEAFRELVEAIGKAAEPGRQTPEQQSQQFHARRARRRLGGAVA